MPQAYKVLGQVAPAAGTDTTLYTVPAATQTVVSSIAIANRAATAATYRIAVRPAGATLANQHYTALDVPIAGNETTIIKAGITLSATDVVTVRASTANVGFQAYGVEIT